MKLNRRHCLCLVAAIIAPAPILQAQESPEPIEGPVEATFGCGPGTTGEVVYNLSYTPGIAFAYGQVPPGFAEDLHLTRSGKLVCFTISVFNASASVGFGGQVGVFVPVDAVVQFYDQAPLLGTGFPSGSLLAEYHVLIPAPTSAFGTVWTITTDLATPLPVPQDLWVFVTTPDAINPGKASSYAGPVFHLPPVAPDVGSTAPGLWRGAPFHSPTVDDRRQAITIRLAEGSEPPTVTCGTAAVLWSPNHELYDISASLFTVEDPDTAPEDLTIDVMVVSDEHEIPEIGDGTGKHAPDFKTQLASGAAGFFLRSERQGQGNGRCYLAIVTASDGDNVVTQVCVLAVAPHSETPESLALVLDEAEARAAALQADIDLNGIAGLDLSAHGLSQHGVADPLGPKQ